MSEVLFIQVGLPNLEQAEASRQITCQRKRLRVCMQRHAESLIRGLAKASPIKSPQPELLGEGQGEPPPVFGSTYSLNVA